MVSVCPRRGSASIALGFGAPADQQRGEDQRGEEIEAPGDLDPADADALGDHHIEGNQEHIRHRQFAHDLDRLEQPLRGQTEVDERKADGLEVGRHKGEEGDYERQEDVGAPERLQSGEDRDFAEREERQETGAHQRRCPGNGIEDQQREVEGAEHGAELGVLGEVCQGAGPSRMSAAATAPRGGSATIQVNALKSLHPQRRYHVGILSLSRRCFRRFRGQLAGREGGSEDGGFARLSHGQRVAAQGRAGLPRRDVACVSGVHGHCRSSFYVFCADLAAIRFSA